MRHLIRRAIDKAAQSPCMFRVSAIGFDKKGDVLGTAVNTPRFSRHHGGLHAEMRLLHKYGPRLRSILICRIGRGGALRPIHPCGKCKKVLDKMDIKVTTCVEKG